MEMDNMHAELLEQAKAHYAADMLLKGTYANDDAGSFKGCSVGCHLFHIYPELNAYEIDDLANKHKIVADYYGYPEWLALLQDTMFEGLPDGDNRKWHVQLAEAIASRNGSINWQETLHRVHIAILRISYKTAGEAQEVVQRVIDLHEAAMRGEPSDEAAWSAAESAARSAARSAAWSAARSAAWSAARSAAESAAWSAAEPAAESAAWSAARSAARSAAESAAWSAAESAAESAAWSAARSAAFQEIRDAVLAAIAA
jgi:hypothetical protein